MHKDYYYLGIITKHFGYKGEVFIYLDTDEPEKYKELDALFIEIDNELIPFIIEKISFRGGNTAVVKFQNVDFENSKTLIKASLFLPLSMLPPLTGNKFYFHEVIGFTVIDKDKGNIGICQNFIEVSQQAIMQIDFHGKEILVPAVNEFLQDIDRENKTIHIQAPEGLIDIYLE